MRNLPPCFYSALQQKNALPQPPEDVSGTPAFTDVSGHWAEPYITKAAALGIVSGVGNDLFSPNSAITRQEIMVLLDRVLSLPDQNGLGFADDGSIAFWALEAAARTTAAGLFSGNESNCLLPTSPATRAQAATLTYRLLSMT